MLWYMARWRKRLVVSEESVKILSHTRSLFSQLTHCVLHRHSLVSMLLYTLIILMLVALAWLGSYSKFSSFESWPNRRDDVTLKLLLLSMSAWMKKILEEKKVWKIWSSVQFVGIYRAVNKMRMEVNTLLY